MSDFNDIDSLEEYDEMVKRDERRSFLKKLYNFMVIVFIVLVGIMMYLIISLFMGNNNETALDVNSNEVRTLYSYVTYGSRGIRTDKFVSNSYVDINNFTNDEKFLYALQFASSDDFVDTSKNNSHGRRIYLLPDSKIREYMTTFFGPRVTYSSDLDFNYTFLFRMNKYNHATLDYNAHNSGFEVVFNSYQADDFKPNLESYYTQLYNAGRLDDGKIIIREKIVYLDAQRDGDYYNIYIYQDRALSKMIGQLNNVSKTEFESGSIDFNTFPNTAMVEYTFGLSGVMYYFESSKIVGE